MLRTAPLAVLQDGQDSEIVSDGATEEETYHQLCAIVAEEVDELRQEGKALPPPTTRAMRDAVPA